MRRRKMTWNIDEDKELVKLVTLFDRDNLSILPKYLAKRFPAKIGNERSIHQVSRKKVWSLEEEYVFFEAQAIIGNKWKQICQLFPTKTENSLKNHFYSCVRKTVRRVAKSKYDYSNFTDKVRVFYAIRYTSKLIKEIERCMHKSTTLNISDPALGFSIIYEPEVPSFTKKLKELVLKKKITSKKMNDYSNKLRNILLNDPSVKQIISSWNLNFNLNSSLMTNYQVVGIQALIKLKVYTMIVKNCIELLKTYMLDYNSSIKLFSFLKEHISYISSITSHS